MEQNNIDDFVNNTLPWLPYQHFFERTNEVTDAKGNFKSKYKICTPLKELSCNIRTAANLKRHILSKHAPYLIKLVGTIENEKLNKRCSSLANEGSRSKQMKIDNFTLNSTTMTIFNL